VVWKRANVRISYPTFKFGLIVSISFVAGHVFGKMLYHIVHPLEKNIIKKDFSFKGRVKKILIKIKNAFHYTIKKTEKRIVAASFIAIFFNNILLLSATIR
jgi:hypothetical protein